MRASPLLLSPSLWLLLTVIAKSLASSSLSSCPQEPSSFKIAGTRCGQSLTRAWREAYLANTTCPLDIDIEGYGWGPGAAQVCGIHPIYRNVDIAGMAGPFFGPQASTDNGWSFDCKFQSERQTILVSKANPIAANRKLW